MDGTRWDVDAWRIPVTTARLAKEGGTISSGIAGCLSTASAQVTSSERAQQAA